MKRYVCLLSALLILGCSKDEPAKKEEDAPKRQIYYKVVSRPVKAYITATGMVQANAEGGAKILAPLLGAVDRILVKNGDEVKKGTPLMTIRSSDVSDSYALYLSSLSQLKQTERTYNLNKQLFDIGAVTKIDLLNSESTYGQAKALTEGLRTKLSIYGADSLDGFKDRVVVKSPIDGRVADIAAHIGDRFDTATTLMFITNPKKIVVVANVYDTDILKLHKDMAVEFSTDVLPDWTFKGKIVNISDLEDIDTKTIKTYIVPSEDAGLFRQNMFLKIQILDGKAMMPEIPKTSMVYKNGKFYVNLKSDNATVQKEIKPIIESSEKMMAVEGLKDDDEIVYSAIELEKP